MASVAGLSGSHSARDATASPTQAIRRRKQRDGQDRSERWAGTEADAITATAVRAMGAFFPTEGAGLRVAATTSLSTLPKFPEREFQEIRRLDALQEEYATRMKESTSRTRRTTDELTARCHALAEHFAKEYHDQRIASREASLTKYHLDRHRMRYELLKSYSDQELTELAEHARYPACEVYKDGIQHREYFAQWSKAINAVRDAMSTWPPQKALWTKIKSEWDKIPYDPWCLIRDEQELRGLDKHPAYGGHERSTESWIWSKLTDIIHKDGHGPTKYVMGSGFTPPRDIVKSIVKSLETLKDGYGRPLPQYFGALLTFWIYLDSDYDTLFAGIESPETLQEKLAEIQATKDQAARAVVSWSEACCTPFATLFAQAVESVDKEKLRALMEYHTQALSFLGEDLQALRVTHLREITAKALFDAASRSSNRSLSLLCEGVPQEILRSALQDLCTREGVERVFSAIFEVMTQNELLLKTIAKIPKVDKSPPLVLAAKVGNLEAVKALLKVKVDKDDVDDAEFTALMRAAERGDAAIASQLRCRGARVDIYSSAGEPALCIAARNGRLGVVQQLVFLSSSEGEREPKTTTGMTPLMIAAAMGNEELVHFLLEQEADINARNLEGKTALMLATENKREAVVKLLVAKGAKTNFRDINHKTVLDVADDHFLTLLQAVHADVQTLRAVAIAGATAEMEGR